MNCSGLDELIQFNYFYLCTLSPEPTSDFYQHMRHKIVKLYLDFNEVWYAFKNIPSKFHLYSDVLNRCLKLIRTLPFEIVI